MLAVTLDGDAAAVVVDEVSPLLMLVLLALLFTTVGARTDLFASENSAMLLLLLCQLAVAEARPQLLRGFFLSIACAFSS